MKNNISKFALAVMAICVGAFAEEMLPKFLGVGFPVLLMAALHSASRRTYFEAIVFAAAAGAAEDALSSLPAMTGSGFFAVAAIVVRKFRPGRAAEVLAYSIFQVWLWIWAEPSTGGPVVRAAVSVPVGWVTSLATSAALGWTERRALVQ